MSTDAQAQSNIIAKRNVNRRAPTGKSGEIDASTPASIRLPPMLETSLQVPSHSPGSLKRLVTVL